MSQSGGSVEAYRSFINPYRLAGFEALGSPLDVTSASGAWLEDGAGRRYLDFLCGFGAATLGHRPSAVTDALHRVLAAQQPFTHPLGAPALSGELAAKLCRLAGHGLTKVHFCNSGSEGVEAALKFAMAHTGRHRFVAFDRAYHGMTLGALSLCGSEALRDPFSYLGLPVDRLRFGALDELERVLAASSIAAVVIEPVQGMAGGRRWSDDDLLTMARLCHAHGSLLIVDEVLTGIGRTGSWFGFQHAGEAIRPDMVVVSKGLTGGAIPLGAVLMTDEVFEATFAGRPGIHGSTFEAHLPGMAVGLAVLETIETDGLLARVARVGAEIESRLLQLQAEGLPVRAVRAYGLLIAVEIDDSLEEDDLWGAVLCRQRLLERGVIVNLAAQNLACLNLTPPFTVAGDEVELFIQRLRESLDH